MVAEVRYSIVSWRSFRLQPSGQLSSSNAQQLVNRQINELLVPHILPKPDEAMSKQPQLFSIGSSSSSVSSKLRVSLRPCSSRLLPLPLLCHTYMYMWLTPRFSLSHSRLSYMISEYNCLLN